jgi:pimeloyl-ACP methyl ester carboxylesterase
MTVGVILIVGLLALVIVAGVLYQTIGSRISARRYPAPGLMIEIEGQRLHVLCAGDGRPPVLFESGIAASSLSWARVVPSVANFTRACAYDRAGLGWSAPSRTPRTVDRMVRELQGVLMNAGTGGPAVFVGHSFGAFLVCAYASRHPADVAGLVLIDPPSEWHELSREQRQLLWGGIQLSRLGGLLARVGLVRGCLALLTHGAPGVPRNFVRIFGSRAARTLERLVGEVQKLPPEIHPFVQMVWSQSKCFRAMADHLAALGPTAAAAGGLTSLGDVPLVIVSSGDQPADVVDKHRQLARLSQNGRHVIATTSGHWIQFDDPDLVVATIRDLIDSVRHTHAA